MSLMPFLKGEYSYDQARETLKQVDVDASGHVELDDYVQLMAILKEDSSSATPPPPSSTISGNSATSPSVVSPKFKNHHHQSQLPIARTKLSLG